MVHTPAPAAPRHRLLVAILSAAVLIDAALLALHLASAAEVAAGAIPEIPYLLDIGTDFGLAERWNAIKWASALGAVLAGLAARRTVPLGVLAAVIAALLIDDYLRVHEAMGAAFAAAGVLPDLRIEHRYALGELLFSAAFGAAAIGGLVLAALGSGGRLRRDLFAIVGLVVLLGGFGVVVDLVHSLAVLAADGPLNPAVLGFVEDGGEMLVTTVLAAAAARVGLRGLHGAYAASRRRPAAARRPAWEGAGARP